MRSILMSGSALAAMAMLSACGGGGGGIASTPAPPPVSGPGPAPAPTPPPPPPPPPPTYVAYEDIDEDRTYQSAGFDYFFDGANFTYAYSDFGSGTTVETREVNPNETNVIFTNPDGRSETFTPADISSFSTSTNLQYEKTNANGRTVAAASIRTPTVNGVELSYTRFATWVDNNDDGTQSDRDEIVFGVPTIASDMPTTGTATYDAEVESGYLSDPVQVIGLVFIEGSPASLTANFGDGTLTTSIMMRGITAPGSPIRDYGVFSGTGSILAGGPGFSGMFSGTTDDSRFLGAFFGPQALEFGYIFQVFAETGATNRPIYAQGTVGGRKQ